jgi:hypothetical protein
VYCVCELIMLSSVVFYVVREVHKFDFGFVVN